MTLSVQGVLFAKNGKVGEYVISFAGCNRWARGDPSANLARALA
jgi:hypothetical protein